MQREFSLNQNHGINPSIATEEQKSSLINHEDTLNDDIDSDYSGDDNQNEPGNENRRTETFEQASPKFIKRVKAFTVFGALMTFVMVVLYPPMTLQHVECIEDQFQNALQGHFDFFKQHDAFKRYLLILFAATTDILLLIFMGRWTYYGGSWRFMISLFLTYSLRQLFTSLFKMRDPVGGQLWEFPGWYSLTVQYGSCNDYYFNPVIAVLIQLLFEFRLSKQRSLMWLSLVALLGEFYLSLCLRGHYIIDNFGGIILGYYLWALTNNWLCYYVDVKIFGMTIHERFPGQIDNNCQNCGVNINEWIQQDEIMELQRKDRLAQMRAEEKKNKMQSDHQNFNKSKVFLQEKAVEDITENN